MVRAGGLRKLKKMIFYDNYVNNGQDQQAKISKQVRPLLHLENTPI